jgi:hypothetical protein
VGRDADVADTAAGMVQDDEAVEELECRGGDAEEVHRRGLRQVVSELVRHVWEGGFQGGLRGGMYPATVDWDARKPSFSN